MCATHEVCNVRVALRVELDAFFLGAVSEDVA